MSTVAHVTALFSTWVAVAMHVPVEISHVLTVPSASPEKSKPWHVTAAKTGTSCTNARTTSFVTGSHCTTRQPCVATKTCRSKTSWWISPECCTLGSSSWHM